VNRTSAQRVLVSTTPDLEGWEITRYLGAVSAHIVAGTNIFSDIAASWSDVFGGQSKSYKKQLEQINEQAIDELREEASNRGGNALVGLRIDHDQISGQSKEMFMVTATATAVQATSSSQDMMESREEGAPIPAREVKVEERTVRLLEKHRNGRLQLNKENWRFLIEHQVSDFAEIVQTTLTRLLTTPANTTSKQQKQQRHLERGQDYLLSIPEEIAKDHLYDMLCHDNREVSDWAVGVLADGNMLDLDRVETLLGGSFYHEQKLALDVLARVDKSYYETEDIVQLKRLQSQIQDGFGKRGEVFEAEKSGMFSSGTEKVWQIKEGKPNPMDQEYCTETGLNIYGFAEEETKPDEAVQVLDTKIAALERRLGSANGHADMTHRSL